MNKAAIVQQIILQLGQELDLYSQSARAAHAEATHEQNKAENKYDTRALEASYLARGQARQAAETEQALQQFQALQLRSFGPTDGVDLGALVELEIGAERSLYFIGPRAGGMEIIYEGKEILVITPHSPLGQQLMGKTKGAKGEMAIGSSANRFKVISVS